MLSKMGFEEKDGGLGKSRQGQLSPVKTILKLDKRGLGQGPKKMAKVTHRQSTSVASTSSSVSGTVHQERQKLTKGQRKRRVKNEPTKEQMREKSLGY